LRFYITFVETPWSALIPALVEDKIDIIMPGMSITEERAKPVPQPTVEDSVAALRQRVIDIFIHDAPTVWRIGGNPAEKELIGLYWPLSEESLAWAVRKSDVPLQFALSRQVKEWKRSGRLQLLMSHWIILRIVTR